MRRERLGRHHAKLGRACSRRRRRGRRKLLAGLVDLLALAELGRATIGEVQRYANAADRKRMAREAMAKLVEGGW